MNSPTSSDHDLSWLVARFVEGTAGVRCAVVLSADGLSLSEGGSLTTDEADRLAAVASGVYSLAIGTSQMFGLAAYEQSILRFTDGHLLISALAKGAAFAVVTKSDARLGVIAHQMALFAERLGENFDPAPRTLTGS